MEGFEVAGRRFRTEADRDAAQRDLDKISEIRRQVDMRQPGEVIHLYDEMQSGEYRFETVVGNDFDDEIYELANRFREQGYTADSRLSPKELKKQSRSAKGRSTKPSKTAGRAGAGNRASGRTVRTGADAKDTPNAKNAKNAKNAEGAEKPLDPGMQKIVKEEIRKREIRRKLLIVVCALVAVGCFGYFGAYSYYLEKNDADYHSLADLKGAPSLSAGVTIHYTEEEDEELEILEEYQTLYNKNKSLIGWLKIDDTNIDYPVMQTVNNEYYLDHNYNQEYDKNGSLFLDKDCDIVHRNTNLIIYGHHMKSGKMFGNLNSYGNETYCREHSIIQFDTIYEKGTYQVMYVFRTKVYNEDEVVFKYYQFLDAVSEKEFVSNMQEMAELSIVDTGVTASYGDELLTLSTCDSAETDGRFVVVAKRIAQGTDADR